MKNVFWCLVFSVSISCAFSQGVSISDTGLLPDSSAILDVSSDNQGVLIPRMNTIARDAISLPADGLLVFNTDSSCFEFFVANDWVNLCSFSGVENDTTVNQESEMYPRIISYGGGMSAISRSIMRNSFQDEDILVLYASDYMVHVHSPLYGMQMRDIRNDHVTASMLPYSVIVNGNLYLLFYDNTINSYFVYRYDVADINAGGMQVSLGGQNLGQIVSSVVMSSNGSDIYFSHNGANSNNYYEIARYSISGSTTFTYQNTITCNTSSGLSYGFMVDNDGVIYVLGADGYVYIYNSSGSLIASEGNYGTLSGNIKILNWNNRFYFGRSNIDKIMNRVYIKY